MSFPSLEKSLEKVSNRYLLVVLAAKRARQLNRGAASQVEMKHTKPTSADRSLGSASICCTRCRTCC